VAWENAGFVSQGQQEALDAGDELLVAAAGEVSAAYAACHEDVSTENETTFSVMEAHAVWGVTGDVE
jgi:hypothetical protein